MQRALGSLGWFLGLFGCQHLGWRIHHVANGLGFGQRFAATLFQFTPTLRLFFGLKLALLLLLFLQALRFGCSIRRFCNSSCFAIALGFFFRLFFALFSFLFLTLATTFRQLLFLTTNQLRLTACFLFAAL